MQKKKQTTSVTSPRDRLSYLWLALGMVLLPFAAARWTIPLAAWLYPVFLLRFVRTQPLWRGILLALLATTLVLEVAWLGSAQMLSFPGIISMLLAFGMGVLVTLPYLIDRVLAPRLGGMLGTLVFPLAVTTVWYLSSLFHPSGTWFNPAYTQYGNLPLLQLLSVTGLWGIVFLMSWLASVVNWAWERGFAWPRVRGGAALYAGLLALVLLFGGARLALFPAQGSTVRVAGISPSRAVIAAADKQFSQLSQNFWNAILSGEGTQADRQFLRQASAPVFAELFAQSLQEARAGAKIILWPECSGGFFTLQEDKAALLARASALAQASGIYLDLGMCVLPSHPVQSRFFTDETALIGPQGLVLWRYEKAHPTIAEPVPPGDGQVPTVQTPYGRLSNVICADGQFPGTLRQAGQAGADIMFMPSNDDTANDPYNTQTMMFRAIENGYSVVRQTMFGLSMTVDYEGNVLAKSDYFATDPQVMVADVPVQGVRTIYATIGDLFAWLSLGGVVVLIGVAIARRRQASEAVVAEPITASPAEASPERVVTDVRL